MTVRSNPVHSYIKVVQGLAPSDSRSVGECLNVFTTLDEVANDSLEVFSLEQL